MITSHHSSFFAACSEIFIYLFDPVCLEDNICSDLISTLSFLKLFNV